MPDASDGRTGSESIVMRYTMGPSGPVEPVSVMREGVEWVEFAISSFGVRIGVALAEPSLMEAVVHGLPPGATLVTFDRLDVQFRVKWLDEKDSMIGRAGYHLLADEEYANWSPNAKYAVDSLESKIQHYVAEFARPFLFVHAGVVGWQGRAILLPGHTFTGKSTLVKALVDGGATYFSDEYAVLDSTGRVHPYARRLSLRDGPLGPAGRFPLAPVAPGVERGNDLLHVGLVAAVKYEANADWSVERLSPPQMVMTMCEHTVAIQRRPKDALDILGKIAESAAGIKGVRGNVHDAVARLLVEIWE